MKNTVKLEQFKEVTEAELQEIQGGEVRKENNFLFYFIFLKESKGRKEWIFSQ